MDVDQEKESDAGVADELSINDMPNEVIQCEIIEVPKRLSFSYSRFC